MGFFKLCLVIFQNLDVPITCYSDKLINLIKSSLDVHMCIILENHIYSGLIINKVCKNYEEYRFFSSSEITQISFWNPIILILIQIKNTY